MVCRGKSTMFHMPAVTLSHPLSADLNLLVTSQRNTCDAASAGARATATVAHKICPALDIGISPAAALYQTTRRVAQDGSRYSSSHTGLQREREARGLLSDPAKILRTAHRPKRAPAAGGFFPRRLFCSAALEAPGHPGAAPHDPSCPLSTDASRPVWRHRRPRCNEGILPSLAVVDWKKFQHGLTLLGVATARPTAFLIFAGYAALWPWLIPRPLIGIPSRPWRLGS